MLLAIDVGNTNVTIGVFDGDRLTHSWRLAALRERTADELGIFVTRLFEQTGVHVADVLGIAIASVVPPLTRSMEEMSERYFQRTALIVHPTNAGMPVR
jgi:type III pantothenate kinase